MDVASNVTSDMSEPVCQQQIILQQQQQIEHLQCQLLQLQKQRNEFHLRSGNTQVIPDSVHFEDQRCTSVPRVHNNNNPPADRESEAASGQEGHGKELSVRGRFRRGAVGAKTMSDSGAEDTWAVAQTGDTTITDLEKMVKHLQVVIKKRRAEEQQTNIWLEQMRRQIEVMQEQLPTPQTRPSTSRHGRSSLRGRQASREEARTSSEAERTEASTSDSASPPVTRRNLNHRTPRGNHSPTHSFSPRERRRRKLWEAVAGGKINKVLHYLENGVSPNIRDKRNGRSLVHLAVENDNDEVLEIVLPYCNSFTINATDFLGQTALHMAASSADRIQCVIHLLNNRAAVDIEDDNGHTPLDCAKLAKNKKVIKILKKTKIYE